MTEAPGRAGSSGTATAAPQIRRARVKEVSSRFMTPLISSSSSATPADHQRSKTALRRHPNQQSLNEPLSTRPAEDENIPDVMRNSTGSQIMSKAAILLSTVQKKQQQRPKILKENGGITVPDTPQSKRVSSSSSSRPDTPYVTGGHDRIVPSRYRTTPHPLHRQTPNHNSGGVPPFSAAAKLVQESTSSAPGSPRSETSTAKDDYTSDNESIHGKSYPNSPLCVSSSMTRGPSSVRSSMPEVDRWLSDSCNKLPVPKCARSLNLTRSSSDTKTISLLPPQPPTKSGLDAASKKGRRVANSHPEDEHCLKLLNNHYLQWRYANARAEASLHSQSQEAERKLYSLGCQIKDLRDRVCEKRRELATLQRAKTLHAILEMQSPSLEEWSHIEDEYSTSLSGAANALRNASLQLPVSGVQVDTREISESFSSAIKVMEAVASHLQGFVPKAEVIDSLASDLARVSGAERCHIEECGDLLGKVYASQITECSLKGHMVELHRSHQVRRSSRKE
ncbi:hypothetical protein DM860_009864 [Cuscuta australis]|uniref:DUF566 domain-containing protein n=1 Tax=Cuscuta australis TaxID=267555 RepID=A0A328DB66_9ASTE|nr:hypothetical protein DM860_009864 [Cuscuta australis]